MTRAEPINYCIDCQSEFITSRLRNRTTLLKHFQQKYFPMHFFAARCNFCGLTAAGAAGPCKHGAGHAWNRRRVLHLHATPCWSAPDSLSETETAASIRPVSGPNSLNLSQVKCNICKRNAATLPDESSRLISCVHNTWYFAPRIPYIDRTLFHITSVMNWSSV